MGCLQSGQLLHDFDAEASPYILSQAALLLSFWVAPEDPQGRRPNTSWLILAIQHAKDAGAHRYSLPTEARHLRLRGQQSHENQLKRLWWSCIIRDRVLSLGLRRALLITHTDFDFESNPCLEEHDLSDEVYKSRVLASDTKRIMLQLTVRFVKLCVILTDLLSLTPYPEDTNVWKSPHAESKTQGSICHVSRALDVWYTDTRKQFSSLGMLQDSHGPPVRLQRDIISLYSHTVFLYY